MIKIWSVDFDPVDVGCLLVLSFFLDHDTVSSKHNQRGHPSVSYAVSQVEKAFKVRRWDAFPEILSPLFYDFRTNRETWKLDETREKG